jgi:hypothetical protein
MFDLRDDKLTRHKQDTPYDRIEVEEVVASEEPDDPLDSAKAEELHACLLSYYRQEIDRQSENRYEQAIEEDYYDNIQWTEEEQQELKERGQAATVYNVIGTSVDWITGSEKRGRTDFKILPRGKEDAKPAEAKTKFMKYLSDVNRTPFHRSRAFEDAVKVGIGWLEEGVQDDDDGEPVYSRYESWRNMLWDSAGTELDTSDWRYSFRSKWVDADIAKALFKNRQHVIEEACSDGTLYGLGEYEDGDFAMDQAESERNDNGLSSGLTTHKRKRVRLIECWYRTPETVNKLKGGTYKGEIYDEQDPRHVDSLQVGASIKEKTELRVRVAVMTTAGLLYEGPSPYRHNRFPFVPIWGYRRGRDGLPYGVIRRMRDIQDSVNKARSKAQYILSTNKVIMDEGAVEDMDAFAKEVSRPDAIIVKRAGKAIELNAERELAPAHLELMSRDISMIQQTSGITDELLARSTNATSGVAIQRRQEQGSLTTTKFFDNLRLAEQLRGEIELSLIEQFVTEEKQFRITNERGTPEFMAVNDGLPENDITRSKADYVIGEADWRVTMRQAAVDQFTELLMKVPPQIAMVVLDLWAENLDIPNRDEIVKRIRSVNGQRDPDATELTPEEQQQMQVAAAQQEMQARAAMAEISELEAKVEKLKAEADRIKKQGINDAMTAANTSMQAATSIIQMPTIAKVADNLLADAGWSSADPGQWLPQQMPQQPMQPQPDPNMMNAADGGAAPALPA